MNPVGMFSGGVRQRGYSSSDDPLPMSGRLIPEFVGRRNIRDMFACKPSLEQSQSRSVASRDLGGHNAGGATTEASMNGENSIGTGSARAAPPTVPLAPNSPSVAIGKKRSVAEATSSTRTLKRSKSASVPAIPPQIGKGQQSLKGFFKPKAAVQTNAASAIAEPEPCEVEKSGDPLGSAIRSPKESLQVEIEPHNQASQLPSSAGSTPGYTKIRHSTNAMNSGESSPLSARYSTRADHDSTHDPIETKESWSKLFTKPAAPRCEGHDEPCITLLTKKPGMNMGRSFWMCPRPLGPSGAKEKNTQWRCQTFIWCSDWNTNAANGG